MITHESILKSPRPVFLRSGSRISAARLCQRLKFQVLLIGGESRTRDLVLGLSFSKHLKTSGK